MPGSEIFTDAKKLHKRLKTYWSVLTGQAAEEDDDDEGPVSKKHKKEKKGPTLKSWLSSRLKKVTEAVDPQ